MKEVGDAYVRAEFQAIKKAKKEEHIRAFVLATHSIAFFSQCTRFANSWQKYIDTIQSQSGRFGENLKKSTIQKMDVEQQAQLQKLKDATSKLALDAEEDAVSASSKAV